MDSAENEVPADSKRGPIGRWLSALRGWQGLTAAIITAIAGIIAANIAVNSPDDGGEANGHPPTTPPAASPSDDSTPEVIRPTVAIRNVTILSQEPAISFRVDGESKDVPLSDDIYLMARPPGAPEQATDQDVPANGGSNASAGTLVSVALRITADVWRVDLDVPSGAVLPLEFVAAIVPQSFFVHEDAGCPPGLECLPPEPLEPEEIETRLGRDGLGSLITSDPVISPSVAQ